MLENTNLNPQVPVQPQPSPIQPELVTSSPSKPPYLPLGLAVVVLLITFGAGGYYLGGQSTNNSQQIIQSETSNIPTIQDSTSQQIIVSPSPTSASQTESMWKTYNNVEPAYTIKYPNDWRVDSSTAKVDSQTGGELIISKGEYKLTIAWPVAYGPSGCVFNDQPEYQTFETDPMPQFSLCEGKFVQFTSKSGNVHRRQISPRINPDGSVVWSVYTKESNSSYFVTVPPVNYSSPKSFDEKEITTMDEILSSFQAGT